MTPREFMKEEYVALRSEVAASLSALDTLEKQCVLATAAFYAWVVTAGFTGRDADFVWGIPVLIAFFGAMQSFALGAQLRRLSKYLRRIELEFIHDNTYATGWEEFHEKASKGSLRTIIKAVAWILFIAITAVAAWKGPTMEIKPRETPPAQTPTTQTPQSSVKK